MILVPGTILVSDKLVLRQRETTEHPKDAHHDYSFNIKWHI